MGFANFVIDECRNNGWFSLLRKKKKNNNNNNNGTGEANAKNNNNNVTVVVLKADLHCEGCASKVLKCIRSFEGVESASIDEGQKIRVVGKVDPVKLREKVEQKTHKKVELISPQPKKDINNGDNKENAKANNKDKKKEESKDKDTKPTETKSDDNKTKAKEPPVTTAVFKVHLHCEGCIQKIYKTVTKTKGYEEIKIDKQRELVTVTGAIDMKALGELLKKTLKKDVEIVAPKKEGGDKDDKKKKKKNNGGDKKGGSSKEEEEEGVDKKDEAAAEKKDPYPSEQQFHYSSPYPYYHAPQIFSDENPNACTVM